jgi:hypothetical protein
VLATALSGFGQPGLPEGPLGARPENHVVVSQPVRQGGADTIGFDVMFNDGSGPAVVDGLVLASPRHIKLIGAYLTIGGPVGNWPTFPPSFPSGRRARYDNRYVIGAWANRHKPAGTIIPPHTWAGVALRFRSPAPGAASPRSTCSTTSAPLITNGTGICGSS